MSPLNACKEAIVQKNFKCEKEIIAGDVQVGKIAVNKKGRQVAIPIKKDLLTA